MNLAAPLLRTRVRHHLVDGIVDGAFTPGQALRIRSLARKLEVSPTPVREALIELERDGWLRTSANRGFTVKPLDADEVRQLYPLIWTLEVHALRETPPGPEILAELKRINEGMSDVYEPREAVEADTRWHRTLLSGSRNGIRDGILAKLKSRAMRYELAYMRDTRRVSVSREQHALIVAHLIEGRLEEAAEVLEENWRIGPRYLLPWLAG
jgi:DNA-binding GntR family transcriptional regulator